MVNEINANIKRSNVGKSKKGPFPTSFTVSMKWLFTCIVANSPVKNKSGASQMAGGGVKSNF